MYFKQYFNASLIIEEVLALPMSSKAFAELKHDGQFRKFAGEPYVEHPKRVAKILRKFKSSKFIDKLIDAAFLHDTIEDTDTTAIDLKKMFGGLVASLVKELTSDGKELKKKGKANYLADKMVNMSSWGLVLKLADRLDNVSDFDKAPEKFKKKYRHETEHIIKELKAKRQLSSTQRKLIKAIERKLYEFS